MGDTFEKCIEANLEGEDRMAASRFAAWLREKNFVFYRDKGVCWRDKIYFWVKYKEECVCFIAIGDPDEPENRWTVWSEDIAPTYLTDDSIDEKLKRTALRHVDECGHCGSCAGGKEKVIFGRRFAAVCGCTFRFDNPQICDMPCMEYMTEAAAMQIDKTK